MTRVTVSGVSKHSVLLFLSCRTYQDSPPTTVCFITSLYKYTNIYMHICIYTYTHTHIYTHPHTYIHKVLPIVYYSCHLIIPITEMPWKQNLPVLVYIELFVGTLKILNHGTLSMNYFSTDKVYIQSNKLSIKK